MEIFAYPDAEGVARQAAEFIASRAIEAVSNRGKFTVAISGGHTPWRMLTWLVQSELPWEQVDLFQVDERVAPDGDISRNWTHLVPILEPIAARIATRVHPIPVNASDLDTAAKVYSSALVEVAGQPPVLDLVHLGLGVDGHTASLVPNDPVLSVTNCDVALTGPYQGQRRVTLTFPIINRARHILWVLAGSDKQSAAAKLLGSDPSVPAGRVQHKSSTVIADFAALGNMNHT